MGRRIVVLSDGTGNSAGKLFRTNVWRFYQALDLSQASQVALYDDGVGSSSFKPLAIVGGAVGWGLKRNILDLYTFLCRNYVPAQDGQPADTIYGIGFSRGAFTIRVLTKFVLSEGLVAGFSSNDELRRKARYLYRSFRRKESKDRRAAVLAKSGRAIRDALVFLYDNVFRRDALQPIRTTPVSEIAFLGLWDTVDAYGLPVYELKRGIDRYIWPLALQDDKLDGRIQKACHALSIDEKRTTFQPLLWDETGQAIAQNTDEEKLTQVWFVGVHSNLGGGYPDDGLSHVSLRWMIREARERGLTFNPAALELFDAGVSPYGRLYNSRAGLAAYYRYQPRRLDPPRDMQGAEIPCPKIHETVIWRMAAGTDAYAPFSLPAELRVVVDQGISAGTPKEPNTFSFEDYRTQVQAAGRLLSGSSGARPLFEERQRLAPDIRTLDRPSQNTTDLIWDTVWWRRVSYFASLLATFFVVIFPFLPASGLTSAISTIASAAGPFPAIIRGIGEIFDPAVSLIAEAVSGFLPSLAKPWIDAFRLHPWTFCTLLGVVIAALLWGSMIDRRIHDRAQSAWDAPWRENRARASRDHFARRRIVAIAIAAVAAAGLAGSIYLFRNPDIWFPQWRKEACAAKFPRVDPTGPFPFDLSPLFEGLCILTQQIPVLLVFVAIGTLCAILILAAFAWLIYSRFALKRTGPDVELPGFALWMARRARTSSILGSIYGWTTSKFVPAAFAFVLVVTSIVMLNRFAFAVMDASGALCRTGGASSSVRKTSFFTLFAQPPSLAKLETGKSAEREVDIKEGCKGLGIAAEEGAEYRVAVTAKGIWRDGSLDPERVPVGPGGFETPWWDAPLMVFGVPIRRALSAPWFASVIRIGSTGREEHILDVDRPTFTAGREGEIFFFVNDAVIGAPYLWKVFYNNNSGTAQIVVTKIKDAPKRN